MREGQRQKISYFYMYREWKFENCFCWYRYTPWLLALVRVNDVLVCFKSLHLATHLHVHVGIHMHLMILKFSITYSYCRNTSMRLFVIGHFSKGKSTLIAALRKTRQTSIFDERSRRFLDSDYHLTEDGECLHACVMFLRLYSLLVHL